MTSDHQLKEQSAAATNLIPVSKRCEQVPPFYVMEVMQLTKKLERNSPRPDLPMLHLEVGQPSTNPPQPIIDALKTAIDEPMSYTTALGILPLRQALTEYYQRHLYTSLSTSEICITMGASGALQAILTCCFDTNCRIGIATPGYPCHRNVVLALDMVPVPLRDMSLAGIQSAGHLDGIIIASPSNPTGEVLTADQIHDLLQECIKNKIRLVFDETYIGISDEHVTSALKIEEDEMKIRPHFGGGVVVTVGSFSKYWCMTGLRVGWIATRDEILMRGLERYIQNVSICAPILAQRAAEIALKQEELCKPELDGHVQRYRRNMRLLAEMLQKVGFQVEVPPGAFYLYAGCEQVCRRIGCNGAKELAKLLLLNIRVAITPAIDFDQELGDQFVRFSCAGMEDEIEQAGSRIVAFIQSRTVADRN